MLKIHSGILGSLLNLAIQDHPWGAFHLTEIPETLLENEMEHFISGMLFRTFRTISRGCPQIGNSGIFEIFTFH
jgi:hypothetical protein